MPFAKPKTPVKFLALSLLALSAGCGQAVIVEPAGTPVMLAEPASVLPFVPDGRGGWIKASKPVEIPAGWVAAPLPATRPSH